MSRQFIMFSVICSSLLVVAIGRADPLSEREMAAQVDDYLAKSWAENEVVPARPSSDAEFLRRAWLDLTGIIPPINENLDEGDFGVRGFLANTHPDKRARLIDHLLSKPTHATHFSNIWKNIMLPEDSTVRQFGRDSGFQNWLRGQFADNVPYNKLVTDLILANGAANQTGPALFYTSLQLKPEELAASTSRIFLGVQIQCAQCHDHPFDHWTRKDFWGYAAFFARLQRPTNRTQFVNQVADADTGEVKLPETDEVIPPRYLGDMVSGDDEDGNRRERLAKWLTSAENPFFARATVNRIWAVLFGRGIVHPVDDLGQHNEPSHPELLDALATYFVETDFDLNRLIRTLALTKSYQLSSQSQPTDSEDRPELFARMAVKSLTAEQLYDCLIEGMRGPAQSTTTGRQTIGRGFDQNRQAFLTKFRAPTQGATEYESGIPQALSLMNGTMIRQATDIRQSRILGGLEAPFFSDEERVETLFLSTLSCHPTDDERAEFTAYVKKGGADGDRKKALGDILWALLNSAEFILNH